jgi:hypothetical protein
MKPVILFSEPFFFPPLKFFHALMNSDIWFVIDHRKFRPRSNQNRCRLRSPTGIQLVQVAVKRPCRKEISSTIIDNYLPWKKLFLRALKETYADAPFFAKYFEEIKYHILAPTSLIETLNVQTTLWITGLLGKHIQVMYSSNYYNRRTNKQRVIEYVSQRLGGKPFEGEFNHPVYKQISDNFVKDLSVLDALFSIDVEELRQLLLPKTLLTIA